MSAKHCLLLCIGLASGLFAEISFAQNIIYEEHFDNNAKGWPVGKDQWASRKLQKGKYYSECLAYLLPNGGTSWATAPKLTLPADNFEIRCLTNWIGNRNTNGYFHSYGLQVGNYRFEFFANGDRRLMFWDGKADNVLVDFVGARPEIFNRGEGIVELRVEIKNGLAKMFGNEQLLLEKKIGAANGELQLRTSHSEIVEFDDLVVTKLPVPAASVVTNACKTGTRNFNETMFDTGFLPDEDILKLPPEKQLVDYHSMYGLCMKVNPLWKKNKKNVIGSTITFFGDDLNDLKSTFPLFATTPFSFSLTLALNPGSLENKRGQYEQLVFDGLSRYFKTIGKSLTDEDWASKWWALTVKAENLVTDEGKTGTLFMYSFPDVPYWDGTSSSVSLKTNFLAVMMIPQPDDKIIQCSVSFERSFITQRPLPDDATQFKMFSPEDEKKCIDFLKAMFRSISGSK